MDAFLHQLRVSLLLHFRNRMALIYSYLFPTMFLLAYWQLYRYDRVPLVRHIGELLTVTILGGACFGLPTTMVSERERGVWRRYRLAPIRTGTLLASTVLARYLLLVLAGLLQIGLAMIIGMPLPNHLFELWVAFTFVALALMGLGLVIATLADTVPAVQALGQCIFLPMLIIGGVAVQLASLPEWAQHVSAFFPGRYAVEAMQACVTGAGLGPVSFTLLALGLTAAAGFLAGTRMFRWDAQQRFIERGGKGWIVVALAAWMAVGLLAEARGRIGPIDVTGQRQIAAQAMPPLPNLREEAPAPSQPQTGPPAAAPPAVTPPPPSPPSSLPPESSPPDAATRPSTRSNTPPSSAEPKSATTPPPASKPAAPAPEAKTPRNIPPEPPSWQEVTPAHIEEVMFERLPSDSGVVTPIARADESIDPEVEAEIEEVRSRLVTWKYAQVADPVQRVRNVLYVAAVPDVFQLPVERYLPPIVFERLQADIPKADLIKILFWVATHPSGGDDSAVDDLRSAGLQVNGPGDIEQARERVMIYALKLLGRLVGKIPS
jgi:ABC-2 type transporter